jgi:putative peptide modification target (TIGR04139 family)
MVCVQYKLNTRMNHPMPGMIWQNILFNKQKLSKMKKLVGMKRNFSSTENKKLQRQELKSIQGGLTYTTSENATCFDKRTWDGTRLVNKLFVGENCGGL